MDTAWSCDVNKKQNQTYNVHDRQDVVLDVLAAVVAYHHLIGHHQGLDKALGAHGAPVTITTARGVVILRGGWSHRAVAALPTWCLLYREVWEAA